MRPRLRALGRAALACAAMLACSWSSRARAQGTVPDGFFDRGIVSGVDQPSAIAILPDQRVLFTEQASGKVRLITGGQLAITDPVVTIPNVRSGSGENGLLGIAVDPGWPSRPYIYAYFDYSLAPVIHISRFTVTGDLTDTGDHQLFIDPASEHLILDDIPDNQDYHNGGTLRFGPNPNPLLYVSLGDDGEDCASQDPTKLQGKILRLDVSGVPAGPGGPPAKFTLAPPGNPFASNPNLDARLVWAFGLRNPFRFAIDAPTGDLYIADPGYQTEEEVDRCAGPGLNFGWPVWEGSLNQGVVCPVVNTTFEPPIYAFDRTAGGAAAFIGGPLYRVPALQSLSAFPASYDGDLFFGDYYRGFLRRLKGSGSTWALAPAEPGQPDPSNWGTGFKTVSDWAVASNGALWYASQFNVVFASNSGQIRRIEYTRAGITNVAALAGADGTTALVRWKTDIDADSEVLYGTTQALGTALIDGALVTSHAVTLTGLTPNATYYYRVAATIGGFTTTEPPAGSPPLTFSTVPPSAMGMPFPSPSSGGAVTLPYVLQDVSDVHLAIYDLFGHRVHTFSDAALGAAGPHLDVVWDGRDDDGREAPAGIYFARLTVNGRRLERRLSWFR